MLHWLALLSQGRCSDPPRTVPPCHPHDTLVHLLVSSRTAGSGSQGRDSLQIPSRRRDRLLRHRPYCSKTHVSWPLVPPTTTISGPFWFLSRSLAPHTAGDGHKKPLDLFKRTSVQSLGIFPVNTPFPRLSIKPISKSPPPPATAPPSRFICSKELVYKPRNPSPNRGLSWLPERVPYSLPRHRGTVPPGPPRLLQKT